MYYYINEYYFSKSKIGINDINNCTNIRLGKNRSIDK